MIEDDAFPVDEDEIDEEEDWGPSRSQRKRDHKALRDIVRSLVALPRSVLDTLPLEEDLRQQLDDAKRLVPKALNREVRHLARQLTSADPDALQRVLDRHDQPHRQEVRALHAAERLRDKLLSGDASAMNELFDRHPGVDRQQFRQWVRAAISEKERDQPPKAARKLFKSLHALETDRALNGSDT